MQIQSDRHASNFVPSRYGSCLLSLRVCIYLAVLGGLFFFIQSGSEFLVGFDGYFHIMYSRILGQEGFIDKLPWLQFTIHKDAFRDHHLLWHYLLIPFTFGDLIRGGQTATLVSFLCAGLALYVVLHKSGVKWPSLWCLAALLSSHPFLYRMALLRVQSLSLALLLLMFILCMRQKYLLIYILSVFFVWLYDGYPLLLLFALIFSFAGWLVEKKPDFKIIAACVLGIFSAMLVNPYFPDNFQSLIYNASRSLFLDVPNMQLGAEWNPYKTWQFFTNSLPAFIFFFATFCTLGFIKKMGKDEFAALLLNMFFLILTLKSRRFVEYWPVFACLNAALLLGRRVPAHFVIIGFLLLSPLFTYNVKEAYKEVGSSTDPLVYKGASEWLMENSEPGENVFHADWDDFPFLFFYNPKNYYIVGLDPMYLYSFDKDKSKLYKSITKGKIEFPAKTIQAEFNSNYVFLDKGHSAFQQRLEKDPQAINVFEDDKSYVYEITDKKEE